MNSRSSARPMVCNHSLITDLMNNCLHQYTLVPMSAPLYYMTHNNTKKWNQPHLWQASLHAPWNHQLVVYHSTAELAADIRHASVSVHTTDQQRRQSTHSVELSHCVHSSYLDSHQDHIKISYEQYIILILPTKISTTHHVKNVTKLVKNNSH